MKELERRIFLLLSEGKGIRQTARSVKKSPSVVVYYSKRFEKDGLLIKQKKAQTVYFLTTPLGIECSQGVTETRTLWDIRWHSLEVKIEVPYERQPIWEQHLNRVMELKDIRVVKLKNNEQGIFEVGKIRAKTTTKGVLFYPQDIYALDLEEARAILFNVVFKIAEKINKMLGFRIYDERLGNIQITKQEIAFRNDIVAKKYIESDLRAIVKINDQRRFIIDFSKRVPEAEFVHRRFTQEDAQKYEDFIKLLITDTFIPSNIKQRIENLEKGLFKVANIEDKPKTQQKLSDYIPDYIG